MSFQFNMKQRLQKFLSKAGIASRRTADEFIRQGRVAIDGKIVTEMGVKVDPSLHLITVDGASIPSEPKKIYILLNKPKGYVTTMQDPQGRPIVPSLLKGVSERVFPVGRLDLDTEGALLLTNDGDLAQKVQHPSNEVNKTYEALIGGYLPRKKITMLEKGIELEGRKTWPAHITVLHKSQQKTTVEIIIHEGRKRQVRKMFAAVGHRVITLKRTAYGELMLGNLPTGNFRFLDARDLAKIFPEKNILYKNKAI